MDDTDIASRRCTFCEELASDTRKVFTAPQANICSQCVGVGTESVVGSTTSHKHVSPAPTTKDSLKCAFCDTPRTAWQVFSKDKLSICGPCLARCIEVLIGDRPTPDKRAKPSQTKTVNKYVHELLRGHFSDFQPDEIVTSVRTYPLWMRPDLQTAIDRIFQVERQPIKTLGLHKKHGYEALEFPDLWEAGRNAVLIGPLQNIEIDLGEHTPTKCLKNALWLLEEAGLPHAVVLSEGGQFSQKKVMQIEIAVPAGGPGQALAEKYFSALDEELANARSYRGKILSLETSEYYPGTSEGILVHKLHQVGRDDIVLPQATLELLERNVFGFLGQRAQLAKLNFPVKKGILFYGLPGTGKTHCIHYLASRLKDHTTLLITAEQIKLFPEYMGGPLSAV